jgi:hypothetical protein
MTQWDHVALFKYTKVDCRNDIQLFLKGWKELWPKYKTEENKNNCNRAINDESLTVFKQKLNDHLSGS